MDLKCFAMYCGLTPQAAEPHTAAHSLPPVGGGKNEKTHGLR